MAIGSALGAAFGATAVGAFLTTFTGRLLLAVGLSALQRALVKRPRAPGITTEDTATGGTNPCGFVLGMTATAGDGVCPPMSHGNDGDTPNAYLTYVIALGDIAGQTLERVAIDGEYVDLGSTAHADYGLPVTGRYAGYAWVKYHDGSQTAADPMLLAKYATYPERPWTAQMIGIGIPYVICTFRYNRERFSGFPRVLFQCGGIKLYDPRLDTTAGGAGAQRWGDISTWGATTNPAVMAYNIARGITLPQIGTWGGDIDAAALPLPSWFAAMNECDLAIGSPGVAQYRAGIEVRVDDEPASIIEELLKVCLGNITEAGGVFKVRVGGPGLPVYFMTDDDIIVSKPQDFQPFPGADERQNGIDAKYPDPALVWATKAAPSRYNPTWEAEDGERRVVSLDLPACPYADQVQRIMAGYIADERRFRRHGLTLPPDAAVLEPLDVVSWTSARNGYEAKLFEIAQVADDPRTVLQRLSLREVDSSDYDWSPADLIAVPLVSPAYVTPTTHVPLGWEFNAISMLDTAGIARRPALEFTWNGIGQDGTRGIEYEVRLTATAALAASGTLSNVAAGTAVISTGLLPDTSYDGRLRFVGDWPVAWTGWSSVTTPPVLIGAIDIDGRGLDILDLYGSTVFGSNGQVGSGAYVTIDGNNVMLSEIAANSLVPSINFIGTFSTPPTSGSLGASWAQNAVYKNATDGKSYILTGSPLAWQVYLEDGQQFSLVIESTNGSVFRVGAAATTMLVARLFKNGAEVTAVTPDAWFRWRRVSLFPAGDSTFNADYSAGYKQISINVDAVNARATFFCDILSP